MRALVTLGDGTIAVRDLPTPSPAPDEVLVKVAAIAQNPTDWKAAAGAPPGRILGVDFAGTVAQVGEGVRGLAVGERVSGFEHGGQYADRGAMAEYVLAQAQLVWRIPEGVAFEDAATMNCGLWTAIQALYGPGRLELAESGAPTEDAPWVLVYSGATSVGMYAVQLAHLSGYRVVTTASPRNFDLLKSLGADVVLDYNDAGISEKIRAATGDTLSVGLDTISEERTESAAVKGFGSAGGKLIVLLMPHAAAQALREDVEIQRTLIYTALGRAFTFRGVEEYPVLLEDRAQLVSWMPKITELLGSGKLKPNPVRRWPGGLDAIKDGFEYMKAGKVRAEKIVYSL